MVVQRVPESGRVSVLDPVATKLIGNAPYVLKLLANETAPPRVSVPEPVEITLPLMVAVLRSEVEILLALKPSVVIPPFAVTAPVVPDTWNSADEVE